MKTFFTVWAGQLVSLLGSGLTNFGLGVWIFQKTGSATLFATVALVAFLPSLMIGPFAGVMVDRWDRRLTMLGSDLIGAACVAVAAFLVWRGMFSVTHVLILSAITSCCMAFQVPAYQAAISTLVPKEQLGRAAGMVQMGQATADLISPILAGGVFAVIGLSGLIILDFCSFFAGVATLAFVRFPRFEKKPVEEGKKSRFKEELKFGFSYIKERRGLLLLLGYFAVVNLFLPMAGVLFGPLILGFGGSAALGSVMSAAGLGMLVGSVTISAWGGPKRRVLGVFGGGTLVGLGMAAAGLRANAWWVAVCVFIAMLASPVMNACSTAIWQSKVAHEVQGRVFSVRRLVAQFTVPFAFIISGPLVDKLLGPMLMPGGALAGSVGAVVGTGPGRGAAVVFVVMGLLTSVASLLALLSPTMRHIERELPDAVVPVPA